MSSPLFSFRQNLSMHFNPLSRGGLALLIMRLLLTAILVQWGTSTLSAQDESIRPPTHTFEDDAEYPEVKRFVDHMGSLQGFSTHVSVHIEDPQSGLKRDLQAHLLVKGRAYRLKSSDLTIYCDGISRWDYLPSHNEVTITNAEAAESPSALSPVMFLKDLTARFKIRYRGQRASKGHTLQDISLYPRQVGATPYTQIHLTYDGKNLQLLSASYHGRDGMTLKIEFTDFALEGYEQESFTFKSKEHPKTKVIDLR